MDMLKRWGSIAAVVVLALADVLETFGEKEAAAALRQSVVSTGASFAALVFVGLKVRAQIQKHRKALNTVSAR